MNDRVIRSLHQFERAILVMDVDETLVDKSKMMYPPLAAKLREIATLGIEFCLASGKSAGYLAQFAELHRINPRFIFGSNGGVLIDMTTSAKKVFITSPTLEAFYQDYLLADLQADSNRYEEDDKDCIRTIVYESYAVAITKAKTYRHLIAEHNWNLIVYEFANGALDFVPPGISKSLAVEFLLGRYNGEAQVFTFGDGINDLPMHLAAGVIPICPDNSHPEVKASLLAIKKQGRPMYIAENKSGAGVLEAINFFMNAGIMVPPLTE